MLDQFWRTYLEPFSGDRSRLPDYQLSRHHRGLKARHLNSELAGAAGARGVRRQHGTGHVQPHRRHIRRHGDAANRDQPPDIRALPVGGDTTAASALPGPELGLEDILRHPAYWFIGISLGLLFSVYTSTLANITPYATGLGTTPAQTSTLIMGLMGPLIIL